MRSLAVMFAIVTDAEVATSGLVSAVVREVCFAFLDLPRFLKRRFASLNIGLWYSIAVGWMRGEKRVPIT
jgi:hypothetical protein